MPQEVKSLPRNKKMPVLLMLLAAWVAGCIVALLGVFSPMMSFGFNGLVFLAMVVVFVMDRTGHRSGVRHKH